MARTKKSYLKKKGDKRFKEGTDRAGKPATRPAAQLYPDEPFSHCVARCSDLSIFELQALVREGKRRVEWGAPERGGRVVP